MMTPAKDFTVIGLGELLWDMLPSGKQLGGAPANFAYHASLLGDQAEVVSRIGADDLGDEIVVRLNELGLSADHVQSDGEHSTGTVQVHVDDDGQVDYTITKNVAWDYIEWTPALQELAQRTDAVCYGSVVQRSGDSQSAINQFLRATPTRALRIFDINLRQDFYGEQIIRQSLELANIAKLNDEELPRVAKMLQLSGDGPDQQAQQLLTTFELQLVCLTRGEHGCLLIGEDERAEHKGFPVKVADAVGAGDAFTACVAYHLLRNTPLATIARCANQLGAWVASQHGATPTRDSEILTAATDTLP